jgi:hypothetical protein
MRIKDIPNATPDEILHQLLDVLTSLKDGHFATYMDEGFAGIYGDIAKVLNVHLKQITAMAQEHHRIMEEVGVTGRLGGQMEVPGLTGGWRRVLDDVNQMGGNITCQFRDGNNVVRDLLHGELSARITARSIQGEFAEFRRQMNKLANEFERRSAVVSA